MNIVTLSGSARTEVGTKDAKHLRRAKRVPCVLYGGDGTIHFSVDEMALNKLVFTPEVNGVEIDLDGQRRLAIIREKQFHPVTDKVLHVDFLELRDDQDARAKLSLRVVGQSEGARKGGKLVQTKRKLAVKGLPKFIPPFLEVDVTKLDLNESIRVRDLKFEGLALLDRPDDVVVAVKVSKKVEAAAAETAAPAKGAAKTAAKK
jgi:large subunit ribosomal protein L25